MPRPAATPVRPRRAAPAAVSAPAARRPITTMSRRSSARPVTHAPIAPLARRRSAATPAMRTVPATPAATPRAARPAAPARVAAHAPVAPAAAARPARPTPAPGVTTWSKEDLLGRFAPLVRHVVERVAATLPRNVDHEDLYSAGVLGLLDA